LKPPYTTRKKSRFW